MILRLEERPLVSRDEEKKGAKERARKKETKEERGGYEGEKLCWRACPRGGEGRFVRVCS